MQGLTLLMMVAVTTFQFFQEGDKWGQWAILPGGSQYVAEMLSAAALVFVLVAGTRNRFQFVRPAYWLAFGAMLVIIVCGILANGVEPGPIFAGIRAYLHAIPWFFVPAVYAFSDRQLKTQLHLLLLIAVVQIPFAVQQSRMTISFRLGFTGDWTVGTLMLSPTLSIFVICGACIATAFFARKRLRLWQFVPLLALLLYPSMINETKASLGLIPLGLLVAFLVASRRQERFRALVMASGLLALCVTVFLSVYDDKQKDNKYSIDLGEFVTDPEALKRYFIYEEDLATKTGQIGRGDALLGSLRAVSSDPTHLAFGYGMGNASQSSLGEAFTGRYFDIYGQLTETSFGRVLMELGVFGLILVFTLMWLVYRDALVVARRDEGLRGSMAAGWAGVTAVFVICIPYTEIIAMTSLSFLFWYFAGLVAAERMRIAGRTIVRPAPPT